jgi:glycosyltransferase involved in cell wall biosynthesis
MSDTTNLRQPSGTSHEKSVVLSVVVPAYNEEQGIADIIGRILDTQPLLAEAGVKGIELVVVDDGSIDRTSEIVAQYPKVRLVRHKTNKGYGAALKTGFRAATGDLLGFLDADGTYPPEYFAQLSREALDGAEMVVGSRRSGASSEMPLMRRIGNQIWSNLVTVLSGQKVIDPASGMRVFYPAALERLYPLPDGLNFTPVMSMRAAHEGVRVVEVPIPYKERLGRSKLNVVRDGMRFLQTILWTALNYNPVRILGGLGMTLSGISALIVMVLVGMRWSGITYLRPLGVASTFVAVVFMIGGVDLFALGITFNYLVSLFHKRPVRQGLFGRPILKTPLDRHFWWMGLLGMFLGALSGFISIVLALNDWPIERLWLYLLAGTMLILVGLQLFIFWVIVRVLEELNQREVMVQNDLTGR